MVMPMLRDKPPQQESAEHVAAIQFQLIEVLQTIDNWQQLINFDFFL